MIRSTRTIALGLLVTGVVLAGCGSDDNGNSQSTSPASGAPTTAASNGGGGYGSPSQPSTAASGAPASGAASMTISGFAFSETTAKAGEAITIANEDSANHTVTADDGSFSVDVPASGQATLTVDKAGTYAIHCKIHPRMKATLTIT